MNDEEVNTIVKAKVDEITKAYKVELDELKTRIEKMESETISKSGVVAILREGDPDVGEVAMTNAGAVASMGKKAKA